MSGHYYLAFEHVVAGSNLSPEARALIIPLDPLSLYCDASGNEREPITVVGENVTSRPCKIGPTSGRNGTKP